MWRQWYITTWQAERSNAGIVEAAVYVSIAERSPVQGCRRAGHDCMRRVIHAGTETLGV
jgi:hypothetical protein